MRVKMLCRSELTVPPGSAAMTRHPGIADGALPREYVFVGDYVPGEPYCETLTVHVDDPTVAYGVGRHYWLDLTLVVD